MLMAMEEYEQDNYDTLMRRLAIESTTTTDIFSVFKRLIPKSAEMVASYIPTLSQLKEPSKNYVHAKERQAVLTKVGKVNFIAYEDMTVFVPEGFKGKLVPYLELLLVQSKVVLDHGKKVLSDYNTELSIFLSNKDIRHALKSHQEMHKKIRKERESLQTAVETYFDKKNPTVSRRRLADVIDRFADLDKVFYLEQKLQEVRKAQDYNTIVSEIQKASDMLVLIKARLDDGSIEQVSGQAAKNIADGAYEVAKYAEYMALYGFFVENALASIRNTSEQLEKYFGK